jgi:hypothetical protein
MPKTYGRDWSFITSKAGAFIDAGVLFFIEENMVRRAIRYRLNQKIDTESVFQGRIASSPAGDERALPGVRKQKCPKT